MVISFKYDGGTLLSTNMDSKDVFVPQVGRYVRLNNKSKIYTVSQVLYDYKSDRHRVDIVVYLDDSE